MIVNTLITRLEWNLPPADRTPAAAASAWNLISTSLRTLDREQRRRRLPRGKIHEEILRFRTSCGVLLGKLPDDGHSRAQHRVWAIGAIWGLRSDHCFGPILSEPLTGGIVKRAASAALRSVSCCAAAVATAALILLGGPAAVHAQASNTPASGNVNGSGNYSVGVTTTPVLVLPDPTKPSQVGTMTPVIGRRHSHVANVGIVGVNGAALVWCSRFNSNPVAGDPSSFPLYPYGNGAGYPNSDDQTDVTGGMVLFPLWCVAASGTQQLNAETR